MNRSPFCRTMQSERIVSAEQVQQHSRSNSVRQWSVTTLTVRRSALPVQCGKPGRNRGTLTIREELVVHTILRCPHRFWSTGRPGLRLKPKQSSGRASTHAGDVDSEDFPSRQILQVIQEAVVISESPNTATSGLRRIPSPEERLSLLVLFASEKFGMLRRSWKIFLAGVVIAGALSLPGSAIAGGEICTPTADLDCSSVTNCLQAAASSCRISCCN